MPREPPSYFRRSGSALIFSIALRVARDGQRLVLRRHQQLRLQEGGEAAALEQHAAAAGRDEQRQLLAHALPGQLHRFLAVAVVEHVPGADQHLVGGRRARRPTASSRLRRRSRARPIRGRTGPARTSRRSRSRRRAGSRRAPRGACFRRPNWSGSIVAVRAAKAAVSAMLSARSEVSWRSGGRPPASMPWRSAASSGPRRRITSARSSRVVLALAIHTSSSAASRTTRVSSLCRPWRIAVVASTSAQTWNRNSRTPSCTGTPSSSLRSSIVYWMASVSRCSTWLASDTPFLVVSFWSRKKCSRKRSNSTSTVWNTLRPVSGKASTTCTTRATSPSSSGAGALRRGVEAHHAGAHAVDQPARRMLRRREEVGLGHRHAQRRHLQAREPDAHRARDAILGQDALEQQRDDLDRGALFLRVGGALERLLLLAAAPRSSRWARGRCLRSWRASTRCTNTCCACAIAPVISADGIEKRCVFMKPWTWRSIVRPKRLSVASTCTCCGDTNWPPPPPPPFGALTLPVTLMPTLGAPGPTRPGHRPRRRRRPSGCSVVLRMKSAMLPPPGPRRCRHRRRRCRRPGRCRRRSRSHRRRRRRCRRPARLRRGPSPPWPPRRPP